MTDQRPNAITLLRQYFGRVRPLLSEQERVRMEVEIDLLQRDLDPAEGISWKEVMTVAWELEPLKYDPAKLVRRILDWCGGGCLDSSLSSLPLLRVLKKLDYRKNWRYWTGRGHVAPALYALKYLDGDFPLVFLATLGQGGLAPILRKEWGAPADVGFNLGVELPKVVGAALANPGIQNVVLMGDSELYSGFTLEALMLLRSSDICNVHLLVEVNGWGISPLPKPITKDLLKPFFPIVIELDAHTAIERILREPDNLSCRTAWLLCSEKHSHSYLPSYKLQKPKGETLAAKAGAYLCSVKKEFPGLTVLSPDMACRFGLDYSPWVTNLSLCEISSPLLLARSSFPRVLATDQKYMLNFYSALRESSQEGHITLLAGKSWKQWGGAAEALNVLSLLPKALVVEPASYEELKVLLREALQREEPGITVLSLVDAEPTSTLPDDYMGHWVWVRGRRTYTKPLVVGFGFASSLLKNVCCQLDVDQLHTPFFSPCISEHLLAEARKYRKILVYEFNGVRGGFGEHLLTSLPSCDVILKGVESIANLVWNRQIEKLGFDEHTLRASLLKACKNP